MNIALCEVLPQATDATANAVPDWVHILPLGTVKTRDGRTFKIDNPAKLISQFKNDGIDIAVDYEHNLDSPTIQRVDGPIPAAGWIKDMQLRENGIWARVEWTKPAAEMLAVKEYRYLSPTINHTLDGQVTRIRGLGLVHRPAMRLTAMCSETGEASETSADTSLALVKATLGLDAQADAATVIATLRDRLVPDPAKYVPVEVVTGLLHNRNEQVALMSQQQALAKVDQATESGYLTPAMRDWAVALCSSSPEAFDGFIASATPAYANLFKTMAPRKQTASASPDADSASVAAQLGLDPSRLR